MVTTSHDSVNLLSVLVVPLSFDSRFFICSHISAEAMPVILSMIRPVSLTMSHPLYTWAWTFYTSAYMDTTRRGLLFGSVIRVVF